MPVASTAQPGEPADAAPQQASRMRAPGAASGAELTTLWRRALAHCDRLAASLCRRLPTARRCADVPLRGAALRRGKERKREKERAAAADESEDSGGGSTMARRARAVASHSACTLFLYHCCVEECMRGERRRSGEQDGRMKNAKRQRRRDSGRETKVGSKRRSPSIRNSHTFYAGYHGLWPMDYEYTEWRGHS